MIDTARATEWPPEMRRAAGSEAGGIEAVASDVLDAVRQFVREKPEAAALWALGLGFVLGWKLKPW